MEVSSSLFLQVLVQNIRILHLTKKFSFYTYDKESICVITCDGKFIVGTLAGHDQLQNLILKDSHERVFSLDVPVELVPLGLYIIRGDNVAIISELDEVKDAEMDLASIRADPIKPLQQNVLR